MGEEKNGNVKWPQAAVLFVSLLGILVASAAATGNTIRQNEKTCEDRAVTAHNRINEMQKQIAANQEAIVQRLARIEAKLEK